jgi:hypothetical protein
MRGGVSLLEVLIAIFVLMVGLLGVVSLIPAGRLEMVEAGKADRASACSQAILREVKIRGLINPAVWRYPDGSPVIINGTTLIRARTFAIDPLFIASNPGVAATTLQNFPYLNRPAEGNRLYGGADMARVTFYMQQTGTLMPLSVAQRLCRWHDDLRFAPPAETDDRPRQLEWVDLYPGKTNDPINPIPWRIRDSDDSKPDASDPPLALYSDAQGDFSWMLTVTPVGETVMAEHDSTFAGQEWYVDLSQPVSYNVSVVIYFRRDLKCPPTRADAGDTPTERTITQITFLGGGLNGGEAELRDDESDPAHSTIGYLSVKENDWIMVPYVPYTLATNPAPTPFEWYRVVATDEEPISMGSGVWQRNVTLEGRTWPFDYNNAMLFSDVIGVFSAIIEPETSN